MVDVICFVVVVDDVDESFIISGVLTFFWSSVFKVSVVSDKALSKLDSFIASLLFVNDSLAYIFNRKSRSHVR